MAKSSSIDNIKLEVMEVQSSDVEIKLGGVMTATTDSSPIDIKIRGTPTTNNEKPKIESLWCNLPELDMKKSAGKIFTNVIETFSTAPTSSDCVINRVLSTEPPKKDFFRTSFFEEFCVSTCSPGGKTWNNVLLGTNGYKYRTRTISRIAQVDGDLYFTFSEVDYVSFVMGAFKLGLQEWKTYPYQSCFFCIMDCLIESEDDENLLKLYHDMHDQTWHVWQFNEAEKVWCELENLGNRMLFVSDTLTSIQLARSTKEEDREGMGSFANTVHVAHSYPPQFDYDETWHFGEEMGSFANTIQVELGTYIPDQLECSSPIYKILDEHHPSISIVECSSLIYTTPDKHHPLCPQIYEIYDWIDNEGLGLTWMQPPQIR
ncbi:hypothetical protein LWI28_010714 [Acer negundo]|uniref:KIB1-4 beta-propeller domain-containing protein n=1 Tax=Acer negundo TaxID=4023 RepID=A0AAD5P1M6_ACENE|nr:hypothetical protein LWI28_010714 [Acer negundo]